MVTQYSLTVLRNIALRTISMAFCHFIEQLSMCLWRSTHRCCSTTSTCCLAAHCGSWVVYPPPFKMCFFLAVFATQSRQVSCLGYLFYKLLHLHLHLLLSEAGGFCHPEPPGSYFLLFYNSFFFLAVFATQSRQAFMLSEILFNTVSHYLPSFVLGSHTRC